MPKRLDIQSVLVIGAGPIVIGQACEFDYSGVQACKALREEGYRVILVNSNPATIMTDPETGDRTYVEPIIPEVLEKIIEKERPDCLLPTLGGQTALNAAIVLFNRGILDQYNVELIGAKMNAIRKAEDREEFKEAMEKIGQECARSAYVTSMDEALAVIDDIGFPTIIRPSFTMGGMGGGMPGMGGMGGMPGMGGMGGMPGMPGMGGGMPDMSKMSQGMGRPSLDDLDAEEDSDDEELPDLE